MRILIAIFISLLTIAPAMAQVGNAPPVSKKAQKYYDDAQDPLNFDRFDEGEKLLLKAVIKDSKYDTMGLIKQSIDSVSNENATRCVRYACA